jgi:hypothetical protein
LFNQIQAFSQNNNTDGDDQQNPFLTIDDYNVVAVGDWYCNEETKKTINNILAVEPELIITTGDQVKKSPSAACWIQMSKPIKDKMKIAIGNHDAEFANIYKQIVDYHNLKNPYYTHDLKNIHFISMSTEHPFELGSSQYEFIKKDLEKSSQNSSIDWIIIHQHKPLYSTLQDKKEAGQLRDTYQQLFQQHDVDLVISSHNQYYERTYPILFNEKNEKKNDKSDDAPQPIIAVQQQSKYPPTNGIVFLTVGTAGDELDPVTENPYFYAVQKSKFGFLNIKIQNNGNTLVGEFLTNDGAVLDHFELNNVKGSVQQGDKLQLIQYKNSDNTNNNDNNNNNNNNNDNNDVSICNKLKSYGKDLMDEWKEGKITDTQALYLGEQAKELMVEEDCIN